MANGKKQIKISKSEWKSIGENNGWTKTAQEGVNLGKNLSDESFRCSQKIDSLIQYLFVVKNEMRDDPEWGEVYPDVVDMINFLGETRKDVRNKISNLVNRIYDRYNTKA